MPSVTSTVSEVSQDFQAICFLAGLDLATTSQRGLFCCADPDKVPQGEREAAEKRFQQINNGNALLTDPDKRAKYDAGNAPLRRYRQSLLSLPYFVSEHRE